MVKPRNWTQGSAKPVVVPQTHVLYPLITRWPQHLCQVNSYNGEAWRKLQITVDSGATETVIGKGQVPEVMVEDGFGSKNGVEYEVANGVSIPNIGEQHLVIRTGDGKLRALTAQVCAVNK